MKRLFFGLWPDERLRAELAGLSQQITAPGLRKLKPANLHNTLLFLGNVDDEIGQAIQADACRIKASLFSFQLDAVEFWQRPQVLCLTASKQPSELIDLVKQLKDCASFYAIPIDKRPYQAHVTLARKAKAPLQFDFEPVNWQAKDFMLLESCSTEQGMRYEVLESWPLA